MFSQGEEEITVGVDPNSPVYAGLYQAVAMKPYFDGDEQGLFHPLYHQVLKMRGNKMIDMFAQNNTGMRIDPATQSVNMFANHLKNHVAAITSWVNGNVEVYSKGSLTAKFGKGATVEINGDTTLVVNGNVDAKVRENATITVGKNVSVKGRDIKMVADQTLHLDGRRILIGLDKADDHNAARYHDYYTTDENGRRVKRRGVTESSKVWMG